VLTENAACFEGAFIDGAGCIRDRPQHVAVVHQFAIHHFRAAGFLDPAIRQDLFAAGFAACLVIFVAIALATMLGPVMPWVDAQRVGAFSLHAYTWSFAVIVIPNLLFIGALLMLLAATTRSMMLVYVGVLGFFVLWAMAGVFTRDINNEWYAVLLDPFGVRAFGRMTRYFTAAESNASLPPLSGFLLANRLLWLGITVVLFAATVILFKPQRTGTGKRLFGKHKTPVAAPAVTAPLHLPRSIPTFTPATAWRQWWQILRFDAAASSRACPSSSCCCSASST